MKITDIPQALTIAWLRQEYLQGEITPEAVVEEIIRRAEADRKMNIWISPPEIEKIRPYLERLSELDPADYPLWGIPFAIKDNIDLANVPTTAGCPDYTYTPRENAAVVERLLAAGAIPVGKTNLDQFATGLVGTRSPYGETHNALREELISGGSSSGSAVAVARGQAAFALGTDTAGSGRVPAALNNLVGYKPSLGTWPTTGVVPACASLDCVTVFTHNLEDALQVDNIARGVEESDPWSRVLPNPVIKGYPKTVCLPKEQPEFFGPYAAGYSEAWNWAVERVKRLPVQVKYVDYRIFSEAAALLYEGPWVAERWADLGAFIDSHPGSAFPVTEKILRSGTNREYDAVSLFSAWHKLQALKLEAKKLLADAVLMTPTSGGTWTREEVRTDPVGTNRDMGRYTNHCNLLDLCAVAVPAGQAGEDLPFGITLFALAENESLLRGGAELFLAAETETTLVAVCGLHMRGYPLEKQMQECGSRFVREAVTSANYQLVKLPTVPSKPGLIRRQKGGSIAVEIWEMPLAAFGAFVASILAPLGIGKVELSDGTEVPGFVCEAYAAVDAEDITASGGWRNASIQIV